jgi:hypothetical protein
VSVAEFARLTRVTRDEFLDLKITSAAIYARQHVFREENEKLLSPADDPFPLNFLAIISKRIILVVRMSKSEKMT